MTSVSPKLSKAVSVEFSLPHAGSQSPLSKCRDGSPCRCHTEECTSDLHNLSASILANPSQPTYKFPQAERFSPIKDAGPKVHHHHDSSSPCRCKLGSLDSLDQLLSADRYNLKSDFATGNGKGYSFGLPHSVYKKTYVPGNKDVPLHEIKYIPGPGAYHAEKTDITSKMSKVTFKQRGKMFNESIAHDLPPCNLYSPKMSLVTPAKYSGASFGYGQKYDFTKVKNFNPGPGAYTPSAVGGKSMKIDVADKL